MNDDGDGVDKEDATRVIISECKDDGTVVFESFGTIKHDDQKQNAHLENLVLPIKHEVVNKGNNILQSVIPDVLDELTKAGFFDGVEDDEKEE